MIKNYNLSPIQVQFLLDHYFINTWELRIDKHQYLKKGLGVIDQLIDIGIVTKGKEFSDGRSVTIIFSFTNPKDIKEFLAKTYPVDVAIKLWGASQWKALTKVLWYIPIDQLPKFAQIEDFQCKNIIQKRLEGNQ